MAEVTSQQLAQLLLGIARSQHALVEALENSKAGFKSSHFRPSIETASRIRSNLPETLADYPSRLLLQMLGRNAPDTDRVMRDLEALLARPSTAAPAAPAGAAAPGPADDATSLDMTAPPR